MVDIDSSEEEVRITFPFLLYIKIENSSLKEMMQLCDGFDVYEMIPDGNLKDPKADITNPWQKMIVDVIEVAKDEIVIKITLRESPTYSEIYYQLMELLEFVKKRTKREIFMHISRILWEKPTFGVPSDIKKREVEEYNHFRIE
ncbi:MAG: hypothetical protein QF682_04040 [Candidatus Thermoplasmatota archaeon]|jgi:hypothetical protein|nr:hypothetical protein [Candidatus Thermoplasmatota archaeon]